MKVINLGESNSVLNSFVAQMRDRKIQKNSLLFRTNLHRTGEIFAYEISKTLHYAPKDVVTPLATAHMQICDSPVVVATILRAGLPLHDGILSFFDGAENAFLAAKRIYDRSDKFQINTEYCTTPKLGGKVLILADTMMATGASFMLAYERLVEEGGKPEQTHIVCPIACEEAVEYLKKRMPRSVTLWTAAIDQELTGHALVVPGLGDAGDLAYGAKL
ncbi:MAG: uracil phosphoribosyltransferase [Bacteroidales bacterium]|nr:uracil phosphoribosyltransferase [Bacteroidales bacterium]